MLHRVKSPLNSSNEECLHVLHAFLQCQLFLHCMLEEFSPQLGVENEESSSWVGRYINRSCVNDRYETKWWSDFALWILYQKLCEKKNLPLSQNFSKWTEGRYFEELLSRDGEELSSYSHFRINFLPKQHNDVVLQLASQKSFHQNIYIILQKHLFWI